MQFVVYFIFFTIKTFASFNFVIFNARKKEPL